MTLVGHVQRLEDGDGLAFRWGDSGALHPFRPGDAEGGTTAYWRAVREGISRYETVGMSDLERQVALEASGRLGISKDAGGNLIVAWYLPDDLARELAMPGGEAPEDLHLTILYLGDPDKYDLDLVAACLKLYTYRCSWPRPGRVGGVGRFVGEDDQDVIVALVDVPELDSLRRAIIDELMCYGVINWHEYEQGAARHGFVPHVTLAYVPRDEGELPVMTEAYELTIDSLTLAFGESQVTFPFNNGYEPGMETSPAYYASRAREALSKAGRVVSAANMRLLTAAKDALENLITAETSRRETDGDDTGKAAGTTGDITADEPLDYAVTKADDEKRYTFGPLYAPDRIDAHGEFTDAETLQAAVWEYVRESSEQGRRLNLQHEDSGRSTVGEWVEVVAWPYETEVELTVPGEKARTVKLPAGTVYMGVIWDEPAWDAIKSRKLGGLSLGGRAVRVRDAEGAPAPDAHMGDKLAATVPHGTLLPIGPDQTWDAGAADKRVRALTGAEDVPNDRYRKAHLWYDADEPDNFGSYKLLVADDVDGALKAMPRALRAAASRLPQTDVPASDREVIRAVLDKYFMKIDDASKAVTGDPHLYDKGADGLCKVCKMSYEEGPHQLAAAREPVPNIVNVEVGDGGSGDLEPLTAAILALASREIPAPIVNINTPGRAKVREPKSPE